MKFNAGDLVKITRPISLKSMKLVGIVISKEGNFHDVWIPDISRSIAFENLQLEKINERNIQSW